MRLSIASRSLAQPAVEKSSTRVENTAARIGTSLREAARVGQNPAAHPRFPETFTGLPSAVTLAEVRLRRPRRPRPRVNLRKTLFVLPNLITLGSVFCGFNAIRLVARDNPTENDVYRAAVLLIFAMLFDTMDGRVARMTKTQSAFGLQLDSLADVISFGVAPSLLVYKWVLYREPIPGILTAFLFGRLRTRARR